MRIYAPFAVVVLACSSSSKSHPTTGKFEDCYYDCKPGQTQTDKPPVAVADNTAKPPAGKPLAGAYGLVTLEPESGRWPPRTAKHRSVEQRGREFLPHVTAIPVGSTVAFPNFDNLFHNVFSTSPLAPFDLGIYKAGEARE